MDAMVRGKISPGPGWLMALDYHYFRAADKETPNRSYNKGSELDLTVKTTTVPGVSFLFGASVFFPDETFAADNLFQSGSTAPGDAVDNGFWAYGMVTARF